MEWRKITESDDWHVLYKLPKTNVRVKRLNANNCNTSMHNHSHHPHCSHPNQEKETGQKKSHVLEENQNANNSAIYIYKKRNSVMLVWPSEFFQYRCRIWL